MAHWTGNLSKEAIKGAALIDKAFQIIEIVGMSPGQVNTQLLLRETGWTRPTLYRILAAVTANGFLRYDTVCKGYTLGYRLLELAQNVWSGSDLASVASNELRQLRDMTGETAYLAVLHDHAMLALGKFEGTHIVRSAAKLGIRKPLHCTSQGKSVLAFLPEKHVEKIFSKNILERFTEHTITNLSQLMSELAIVRQRGYAVENEEIIIGNRCVGAPIFDNSGKPVAAISVAGPVWRMTRERVEQLGPEVALAARNISVQLRSSSETLAANGRHPIVHPGAGKPAFYGADPLWDNKRQVLLWTDRLGPAVIETNTSSSKTLPLLQDEPIRSFNAKNGIYEVWQESFRVSLANGAFTTEASTDAKNITASTAHPDENIWIATKNSDGTLIHCVSDCDQSAWQVVGNIDCLAWTRDGSTLYAADAARGTIYSMQRPGKSYRIFSRISRASGEPRAIAADFNGRLWVALYGGWSVARLSMDGEVDRVIALPVPRPTGLTFGGAENDTLYVTSARVGLTRDVLDNAPLSGLPMVIDMKH